MKSVSFATRTSTSGRIGGAIIRNHAVASSAMRSTSVGPETSARTPLVWTSRRRFGLLLQGRPKATQQQQQPQQQQLQLQLQQQLLQQRQQQILHARNLSSISDEPHKLTPEEAGRRAAQLASEQVQQKHRLRQLLGAVDWVEEDGDIDEDKDNDNDGSDDEFPSLATLLSHAGIDVDMDMDMDNGCGELRDNIPMSPPLHTATTYTRPADGIYKDGDSIYARMDNPTRLLLERCVHALECSHPRLRNEIRRNESNATSSSSSSSSTSSFAFSSGMQASTAILLAHSTTNGSSGGGGREGGGMTVLIPTDVYHGVRTLLSDVFSRHGVAMREIDMVGSEGASSIAAAISEIATASSGGERGHEHEHGRTHHPHQYQHQHQHQRHTVIVWMETPSNPRCEVVDIRAVCDAVRSAGDRWKDAVEVTTVVDGTMASPFLTRPLELGADVSFHSGTKYLAGHSDALIGTLTLSPVTPRGRALAPLLRSVQIASGGVASPWDCWLTLRGMRTLHVRVQQQCQTALRLAEYLYEKQQQQQQQQQQQERNSVFGNVKAVHYPGLPSHPQHDVATRQMALGNGNTNGNSKGNGNSASASSHRPGFGGVLSFELPDRVAAMAFAGAIRIAQRATSLGGTETLVEHRASIEPPDAIVSPPGLLRVSVGLEDVDDLIRDFEKAFGIVERVLSSSWQSS